MSKLAPIALFVYNRPWHTRQTLEALAKNKLADQSNLIVFADGPKPNATNEDIAKITEVRAMIRERDWCKTVTLFESEQNKSLADSIVAGVTKVVNEYGKIIVLEDDLITSPFFLPFMNDGLNMYENETEVFSISGYQFNIRGKLPKTSFVSFGESWGWATWQRAWQYFEPNGKLLYDELQQRNLLYAFDFNGSYPYSQMLKAQIEGNSSWAIRWCATIFLKNKLMLVPYRTLIYNIGFDGSGTNCSNSDSSATFTVEEPIKIKKIKTQESAKTRKELELFYRGNAVPSNSGLIKRHIKKISQNIVNTSKGYKNLFD